MRRVSFKNQFDILLSDTVGFIRKLPHHLIASFKSTLGEATDADLLVHIADITHPQLEEQISSVNEVLEGLEILDKPTLMVFNKLDMLKDDRVIAQMKYEYKDAVFISAKRGIGLNNMLNEIINQALKNFVDEKVNIPFSKFKQINKIRKFTSIISTKYNKDHISMHIKVKKEDLPKIKNILEHEE